MKNSLPARKQPQPKRKKGRKRKNRTVHPAILARLERSLASPVIGSPQFAQALAMRCGDAFNDSPRISGAQTHRLASAIKVMLDRPFAPHTVETLATAAGMSRASFAKQFSESIGRAPIEFLKYERLRYAAHLLRTTALPVKVIVGMIGYVSSSYFSRAFQSAFDLSPSAVRRNVARAKSGKVVI